MQHPSDEIETPSRRTRKSDRGFTIAAACVFGSAFASQAYFQLIGNGEIIDKARKLNKLDVTRVEQPRRGTISAADGRPLAEDIDSFELRINYLKVPQVDGFYLALASASGIPASEFSLQSRAKKHVVYWKESISAEQRKAILAVKTDWHADGLSVERAERRLYNLGESAATLVGLKTQDQAYGLELSKNADLSGKPGKQTGLVDRQGEFLPMRIQSSVPAVHGQPVLTTIQSDVQLAASQAVKDAVESNQATNGVAVVMNPKTGDVLAMASWPSFDPNRELNVATASKKQSKVEVATRMRFEPGSTFKILTVAKALDEGKLNPHESFFCNGQMYVGKRYLHCDKTHGAHGNIDPELAIAKSCNVAAASWALRIGRDGPHGMVQFLDDCGLLKPTDIGLKEEIKGQFRLTEPNRIFQLASLGFGQSIAVTPISMCSAFSSIANGGVRMKPRLVQKVGDRVTPVQPLKRLFKGETCKTVMQYMERVMSKDGTGKGLIIENYRLAGKTGTANKVGSGGGHVANFVGFVPADAPKAVVLVMINDPKVRYYGADVAGPAFKKIAESIIRRFDIQPSMVASISKPVEGESAMHVRSEAPKAILPKMQMPKRPTIVEQSKVVTPASSGKGPKMEVDVR